MDYPIYILIQQVWNSAIGILMEVASQNSYEKM